MARLEIDMTETTMQHKIANIVDENFLHGPDATARAIIAALPDLLPDLVSPLVWQRNGSHWAGGHGYVIRKMGKQYNLTGRNAFDRQFDTLEQAQSAASARHVDAAVALYTGAKP